MVQAPTITLKTPSGTCRACGVVVSLQSPRSPSLCGSSVHTRGLCPTCGRTVSAFFAVSPITIFDGVTLSAVNVALLGMGLSAGCQQERAESLARRNDDMLRIQRRLRLTYHQVAACFGLSVSHAAKGLADARVRVERKEAIEAGLLQGRQRGRTYAQLGARYGLTEREVASALVEARNRRDAAALDEKMARWRAKGWTFARVGRKYGIPGKEVKHRLQEARRRHEINLRK